MRHITARGRPSEALPRRRNAIRETEPKRFRRRPATILVELVVHDTAIPFLLSLCNTLDYFVVTSAGCMHAWRPVQMLSPVSNLIREDPRRGVRVMQAAAAAPGPHLQHVT